MNRNRRTSQLILFCVYKLQNSMFMEWSKEFAVNYDEN